MSINPTTSALLSLLPTYTTTTLPPVLHETATGLLAQSRSRAAVLKPEEEVARGWACAEIAVRRLQMRLNLPAIFSNPPCAPRTYKKLYQFLDQVLVSHTALQKPTPTPVTPNKRTQAIVNDGIVTDHVHQGASGSSKTKGCRKIETSTKRRMTESDSAITDLAPAWLGPTIRHLCRTFSSPAAVPHVFVGVVSHLRSQATISMPQGISESDFPIIVAAIFLLTLKKMQQQDVNDEGLKNDATVTNAALPRLIVRELIALGRVSVIMAGVVLSNIEKLMEDQATSWMATEWFENVPNGDDVSKDDKCQQDEERECDTHTQQRVAKRGIFLGRQCSVGVLRPKARTSEEYGLGAIDWLSETRCEDHRKWKAALLERIEQMENAQA